ncbi:glycosyltransferase family 9 protein [Oleiagrimonas sp. C23AA]|uniref:glycosyltransferase family 9 protein n=1 Tax=Oleiagrimonas sp. C23AA TaxID=2719047 RepID=UPI00141E5D83|nr:glycosyltransferase family 9 protein [Oleiagrimonas sp. C23AA]NII09125.1 glycosyltransferase family 9 protein [Oleiagrimonas sp. C23AA]
MHAENVQVLKGTNPAGAASPLPSFLAGPERQRIRGKHRILVCHPNSSLGNSLLLTPLLQELEYQLPGAEVDILTRSPSAHALYGGYGQVRNIFPLPSHAVGHLPRYLSSLGNMRARRYDLAIDTDVRSRSSRVLLNLAQSHETLGYGGAHKPRGVTHAIAPPSHLQAKGKLPVYLLRQGLDLPADDPYPAPDIRLSAREHVDGLLALRRIMGEPCGGRNKVMGIFANATGPKLLPPDWWQAFLQALEAINQRYRCMEILPTSARSMLADRYPGFYSSDLRKLAGVLHALDAFVSLDCGVMHLGSAAGARTVAIFTTTSIAQWGPYGSQEQTIDARDLSPQATAQQVMRACQSL